MTLLALDRVSKSYWRGRHRVTVLDSVSCELEAAEFAAVFGQRASGKTTLLRIAAGMEAPDSGTVQFEGRDLADLARRPLLTGLPARIGWVRRPGPAMDSMRMLDYVTLPLLRELRYAEAYRSATAALEHVRAGDLARARWHELSDAERTLVMVAQAIVRKPALLLADDPTMGLDLVEREIVTGLLRETSHARGMAVLMTVPELPDSVRSHRVMSLSAGELIQSTRRIRGEVIHFPHGRGESA